MVVQFYIERKRENDETREFCFTLKFLNVVVLNGRLSWFGLVI